MLGLVKSKLGASSLSPFLDGHNYNLEERLLLESLDSVSFKVVIPEDGPCISFHRQNRHLRCSELFDELLACASDRVQHLCAIRRRRILAC